MVIILDLIRILVESLVLLVPILISVAFATLVERKVMAAMQRRRGPNVVGIWGLLQPFADGLKLIVKETVIPGVSNKVVFLLAPLLTFGLSLLGWVAIPVGEGLVIADINVGIMYLFAVSSLEVYGIICAGWGSNSQYAFLGALRSAAQMISYEVSIGLIIICIILCSGSMNLTQIVKAQESIWYVFPLFPLFIMFFVSALAETNRPPFDLPEAEAELVAGYNVEYSGLGFALFFIGEYANIILMSAMCTILFLGGWLPPFNLSWLFFIPGSVWFGMKVCFIVFLFVWVRASFPRYRYDQLMRLGWKVFLPLSIGWVIFFSGLFFGMGWLV